MSDDMTIWEPVAEQLHDLSISGLETLKGLIEYELEKRRAEFLEPKKPDRPALRVIKTTI